MSGQDGKKRINITIGPAELARARQSGETVSGYIGRLIREDADAGGLRVELTAEVEEILHGSGVLDGPRRAQLMADVTALILRHADQALSDSRYRIQALMEDISPSDLTHPEGFDRPKG